jgi:ligand-binding sensor domain-containing protein
VHSLLVVDSLLWVGTDEGIARYDRRTGYSRNFSTEDGLIDNRVFDIELDGDCLWFATPGGVTRFYWNNPYRID